MQQELKFEAYRMETVRKTVERVCFERCIPAPSSAFAVLAKAAPDHLPLLQSPPSFEQQRAAHDLSPEEALCVDRCSWKYMATAKIVLTSLSKSSSLKSPEAKAGIR